MAAEVPGFDALPPPIQFAITVAVGAGALIASVWTYVLRRKREPDPQPGSSGRTDLVVTSATIADMAPLRELPTRLSDLQNEFRGMRHACEQILAHLIEVEREREEDRRVERRVKEELLQRIKST